MSPESSGARGRLNFGAVEAARLARQGNVIPLVCELPGDLLTPVGAFIRLAAGREHAFLLESVEGGDRVGRYSFLGCDPVRRIERDRLPPAGGPSDPGGADGPRETARISRALDDLRSAAASLRPVKLPDLPPFTGGFVGRLAYDAVRSIERLPGGGRDDLGSADLDVALYDTVVAFDRAKQRIQIIANLLLGSGDTSVEDEYRRAEQRIAVIAERLGGPLPADPASGAEERPSRARARGAPRDLPGQAPSTTPRPGPAGSRAADRRHGGEHGPPDRAVAPPTSRPEFAVSSSVGEAEFERMVLAAKEEIACGEIFQVVLSRRLERGFEGEPFSVYRALRTINPSPYHFYLKSGPRVLAGASPEMLVRVRDGVVEMRPIAGTRRRSEDEAADDRLARELRADPKEMAEHLMLVDLGRNDLGRIAASGTVRVSRFAEVERYSHVMHLVSSLEADRKSVV